MLIFFKLSSRLKQAYSFLLKEWPTFATLVERHGWSGFVAMLGLLIFILAWSSLTVFSSLYLVAAIGGLAWFARQWPALQISSVIIVALAILISLTNTTSIVMGFMIPVMGGLILLSLLLASVVDFARTGLTGQHVAYVYWSVIISGLLQLILSFSTWSGTGLHYAGLPLTAMDDFLILAVVVMMFLYLLFVRGHSQMRGSFLGLLPALLIAAYLVVQYPGHATRQAVMPNVMLEHGLLLIHVPVMVLAFALLINAVGFALLRLLSDCDWLRARQNVDILETIQIGLENYLYRLVTLAVMFLGLGLFTGMLWSNLAWGHYWQAEAKQLMSLALWLYYLAGLHFRLQKGMQMRPFAWWCVAGLPLIIMTLLGTNLWPQGLHNFTTG